MDTVSKERRSQIMSAIGPKDTAPEKIVRAAFTAAGIRYRLNHPKLPGRPDLAITTSRIAIFVHGCFWHQHKTCGRNRIPRSNASYWIEKFVANAERDRRKARKLRNLGWSVRAIWECDAGKAEKLKRIIDNILDVHYLKINPHNESLHRTEH